MMPVTFPLPTFLVLCRIEDIDRSFSPRGSFVLKEGDHQINDKEFSYFY